MKKRIAAVMMCVCVLVCTIYASPIESSAEEDAESRTEVESVISEEPASRESFEEKENLAAPYELSVAAEAGVKKTREVSTASGDCGENGNNITWSIDQSGVLTLTGSGKMADYPSGAPWIGQSDEITDIRISDGITYLGTAAFFECSSVTEVTLPDTLQSAGQAAFGNCRNLRNVTLNEGITTVPDYMFQNCGIETILLPGSLSSFSPLALFACPNLQSIEVAEGNPDYVSKDGVLYTKDTETLVSFPSGSSEESFTVPDGVRIIGRYAFVEAGNLHSIILAGSVTELQEGAFLKSGLESLDIPDSVTGIGDWLCESCDSLKSLSIGSGLKSLAYQAFLSCTSLVSVDLGSSLTDLDQMAFADCTSLREVTIPASIVYIAYDTFPSSTELYIENPNLMQQEDGSYMVTIPVTISAGYKYNEAFKVLNLVNQERAKKGLSALKMDRELLSAAMLRAAEISIYFEHTRPTGLDCFTASEKMHGENIAAGQISAEGVMYSWMDSSGHRGNILGESYQSIGVGAVEVDGCLYWVQCFGGGEAEEVSSSSYGDKTENVSVMISDNDEEFSPVLDMRDTMGIGTVQTAHFAFFNGFVNTRIAPQYVDFASSNEAVCTVSEQGKVNGLRKGSSEIQASLKGYPQICARKKITVSNSAGPGTGDDWDDWEDWVYVSKIKISGISQKIAAGKKIKLTANISPSNASYKTVSWKSSNTKAATVNNSGVVTMKKGSGGKSVTITAAAEDWSGAKATYKITSMKGVVKKVAVTGKKSVKAGKTLKLKAKVTASKGANKKLKWTSSNKKYATVSGSGKVKALKAGKGKKVKITAMATDGSGKKRSVTIKIK